MGLMERLAKMLRDKSAAERQSFQAMEEWGKEGVPEKPLTFEETGAALGSMPLIAGPIKVVQPSGRVLWKLTPEEKAAKALRNKAQLIEAETVRARAAEAKAGSPIKGVAFRNIVTDEIRSPGGRMHQAAENTNVLESPHGKDWFVGPIKSEEQKLGFIRDKIPWESGYVDYQGNFYNRADAVKKFGEKVLFDRDVFK